MFYQEGSSSVGKESACSAGDTRDAGLILGSGRSPGEGNGNPVQYSGLGNPMPGGLQFTGSQGVRRDSVTEHTHMMIRVLSGK